MAATTGTLKVARLARSYRGPIVEAEHYGQVVVCDAEGELVAALGESRQPVVLRSAAKPLQALSVVTSGAAEKFGLEPRHLAICCASHQGAAAHLQTVAEILERLGLDETALDCGTHWPDDAAEADRLKQAGLPPGPLHNNCSGKHAGMLATALALGASPRGYLDPGHPVQALIRQHLALFSGEAEADFLPLLDGCGAPTYALPLRSIAVAFARLASPISLPAELQEAPALIYAAMVAHPEMIQGPGTFNTELLRAGGGRLVAKGGAEGLFALSLPQAHWGIAVKISDGSGRAWPPVVLALLRNLLGTQLAELTNFARPEQRNCHGEIVGHLEPDSALEDLLPSTPLAQEAIS